jgi:hypothetical protein
MRRLLALPLLPLLATTAALAQGTPSLGIASDAGAAIPVGAFASDGASVGLSLGLSAAVRLTRVFGIYTSLERTAFPIKQSAGAPGDGSWKDMAVGGGVRLWLPVPEERRLHPWAQVGFGWHNLDAPIVGQQFSAIDTKGLRTLEAGAGVDIALESKRIFFLRPIVRYRRYAFALDAPPTTVTSSVSYLTLGVGLVMAVGPGASQGPTNRPSRFMTR